MDMIFDFSVFVVKIGDVLCNLFGWLMMCYCGIDIDGVMFDFEVLCVCDFDLNVLIGVMMFEGVFVYLWFDVVFGCVDYCVYEVMIGVWFVVFVDVFVLGLVVQLIVVEFGVVGVVLVFVVVFGLLCGQVDVIECVCGLVLDDVDFDMMLLCVVVVLFLLYVVIDGWLFVVGLYVCGGIVFDVVWMYV